MNGPYGRTISASKARPEMTTPPAARMRRPTSWSSRGLPIPASPRHPLGQEHAAVHLAECALHRRLDGGKLFPTTDEREHAVTRIAGRDVTGARPCVSVHGRLWLGDGRRTRCACRPDVHARFE